jgi:hypothetical protein
MKNHFFGEHMNKLKASCLAAGVSLLLCAGAATVFPNLTSKTQAQTAESFAVGGRLVGNYAVRLSGSTIAPGPNGAPTRVPIELVGQFTSDGRNLRGTRTLVVANANPAGPSTILNANFTATNFQIDPRTGTGQIGFLVNDATTPPGGRVDTFQVTLADNGKELRLVFLTGLPNTVVGGNAIRQN